MPHSCQIKSFQELWRDIVDLGVFIHDLFATNYREHSSPDQLAQLSLEELKRDVTFADLGPLLQSIFRGEVGFASEIAEWFTEVQRRSASELSAQPGMRTLHL